MYPKYNFNWWEYDLRWAILRLQIKVQVCLILLSEGYWWKHFILFCSESVIFFTFSFHSSNKDPRPGGILCSTQIELKHDKPYSTYRCKLLPKGYSPLPCAIERQKDHHDVGCCRLAPKHATRHMTRWSFAFDTTSCWNQIETHYIQRWCSFCIFTEVKFVMMGAKLAGTFRAKQTGWVKINGMLYRECR